jgi:hypothetical protein
MSARCVAQSLPLFRRGVSIVWTTAVLFVRLLTDAVVCAREFDFRTTRKKRRV